MKNLLYLALAIIAVSCGRGGSSSNHTPDSTANLKNKETCSYMAVKSNIENIKNIGIEGIAISSKQISACINVFTEAERDSVFTLLYKNAHMAAERFNDSLYAKSYKNISGKLARDVKDAETNAFKLRLDSCGIMLHLSDGMYTAELNPSFFQHLFGNHISEPFQLYINQQTIDKKQGYINNGDLIIRFEQLYERIVQWENFMDKYPDSPFINDIKNDYYDYLSVLMVGTTNTPTFDYDLNRLKDELIKLYEKISKKTDGKNSTRAISKYYNLLRARNFKKPDGDLYKYLKDNGFNPMLGMKNK